MVSATSSPTTATQSEEADMPPPSGTGLSLSPLSADFKIDKTAYGGRGCFAMKKIPKGTVVLECTRPLLFTITKEFKKEVCNWCFRYDNGETMKSRLTSKNGKLSINFCSSRCLELFKNYDIDDGLLLNTLLSIEKLPILETEDFDFIPTPLTREDIDLRWGEIQQWEANLPKKLSKRDQFMPLHIDEATYDDLRYLAVVVFELIKGTSPELEYFHELQSNEYDKMMRFPHLLDTSIKIFQLLKLMFPESMQPLITIELVRSTLGKENGNAFGIWSPQLNDEYQEYLGFGLYPSASFFNHSCCPNLQKKRENEKLVFTTIKDINPNEEMYINYGSTTEKDYIIRQASLKEWFFECSCNKCLTDELDSRTTKLKL